MDIVDRIRQLANQKKISLTKIEKTLGFGNGTIGKWIKQSPSCEKIKLVADFLNTSTDYLIYGGSNSKLDEDEQLLLDNFRLLDDNYKNRVLERAETLKEISQSEKLKGEKTLLSINNFDDVHELDLLDEIEGESEEEYIYLPLPDIPASAGTGMYLDNAYAETIRVKATDEARKSDYAIRVSGNSMEPRYYDGDILAVCEQTVVDPGEVGVFVYDSERYVKQFGGNRLISINPDYEDIHIKDPDSFFCQGKVIAVLQLGKKNK